MSARFDGTNYLEISNHPVGKTFPWTVMGWIYFDATGSDNAFIGFDNGSQDYAVRKNGSDEWSMHVNGSAVAGGTVAIGQWHFIVHRGCAANNHRLDVLNASGAITSLQHTGDLGALGTNVFNHAVIGAYSAGPTLWRHVGRTAELMAATADIQPDGAALAPAFLRWLAYHGPFSVPHIKKDIIEYQSFRSRVAVPRFGEVYWGHRGPQTWTNVGSVTIGPHVKLPASYRRPIQDDGIITVLSTFNVDEGDATVDITGGTVENDILTANFHDDDPDGPATGITYQWERSGTPIGGETASTYQLQSADVGETITVVVDYTDGEGFAESIESAATATITAFVSNTGTDVKGLSIGKGLAPWKGLSKDKGLSWRKGL